MPEKDTRIIDGVYALEDRIAEGGMAAVYRAKVDLNRFDYTRLYAYTQVKGDTHAERWRQAEEFAARIAGTSLDLATVRAILEAHRIPLPGPVVAVKVAKSDMDIDRFEAEWRLLLCLSHDNVIKVYGGGVYLGRPYYAMELLEGIVAPQEICERFTLAERIGVALQATRGLGYLHDRGIVHRDVKPDNLVTTAAAGGCLTRVTDLGLAKELDAARARTASGQLMGTPYFMAPEQMVASRDVDRRADVYSLGASLYMMLVGVPPYHDKTTVYEIVASVTRGELPIQPKAHLPWLPDALERIVMCAMHRNPEFRYQTMADFGKDLASYLAAERAEVLGSAIVKEAAAARVESSAYPSERPYIFDTMRQRHRSFGDARTIDVARAPTADAAPPAPDRATTVENPARPAAAHPGHVGRRTIVLAAGAAAVLVGVVLALVFGGGRTGAPGAARPLAADPGAGTAAVAPPHAPPLLAVGDRGLVATPSTPREHYHNARLYELGGDMANARRSYAAYFAFAQEHVDPHLDYATMLKMSDGIEGAREVYAALTARTPTRAARLAQALLAPREMRIARLEELQAKDPDYAPAAYYLSREYARETLGAQTLAQKMKEKEHLRRFFDLDGRGEFVKHFLDKRRADEAREDARRRRAALEGAHAALEKPVRLTAMKSNIGWMVTFMLSDYAVREILYQVGPEGTFTSTGQSTATNTQTGLPMPTLTINLPLRKPRTDIYVKLVDVNGVELGPYALTFDPDEADIAAAKSILKMTEQGWVMLRQFDGKLLLYFTSLLVYRSALVEIRWSLDAPTLDRRFPFAPKGAGDDMGIEETPYLEIPVTTKRVHVQLVFKDGTSTDVKTFEAP